MILVSNSFFVVLFALLSVAAVMMARRGWAGEAVSATVAAVGCVLPLASVWAAPAARDGNVGALILVAAARACGYSLVHAPSLMRLPKRCRRMVVSCDDGERCC